MFPALGFTARFRKICKNKRLRLLGIPPKLIFIYILYFFYFFIFFHFSRNGHFFPVVSENPRIALILCRKSSTPPQADETWPWRWWARRQPCTRDGASRSCSGWQNSSSDVDGRNFNETSSIRNHQKHQGRFWMILVKVTSTCLLRPHRRDPLGASFAPRQVPESTRLVIFDAWFLNVCFVWIDFVVVV